MHLVHLLQGLSTPIIDVRSEGEYEQGHIPGAINIPLLNNNERHLVGICYKQKGQSEAIDLGYELVGPKFDDKLQEAREAIKGVEPIVYCWRGGLRSKIFTELLLKDDIQAKRLENGYKSFRQWVLEHLTQSFPLIVLGGNTGSGKTEILFELKRKGAQIIDLEGLANHRGSAFGGIGLGKQPTQEQFENLLAIHLNGLKSSAPIWVEDESKHLGRINIPMDFRTQMRDALMVELSIPIDFRKERIVREYARLPKFELIEATRKLEKRLGNQQMNLAIDQLNENNFDLWADILLAYYDKLYAYGKSQRQASKVFTLDIDYNDIIKTTVAVQDKYDNIKHKIEQRQTNTI